MSVTSGFYNSLNGDRKYDASQMSSIFDGLITDGIFGSIGTAFAVKAAGGLVVNVGVGRAWFNHTWTYNDSVLPLTAPDAEVLLDRIDAIVLEVNSDESVRANTIKFVKGTAASTPENPTLTNDEEVHQYPLCYIYRKSESTEINQADITSMIGTDSMPFITGLMETVSLDELLGEWENSLDLFTQNEEAAFDYWFAHVKAKLSDDVEANLLASIDREEVNRILLSGFEDGTKVFSDDGTVITSTASDGRTLTKTFSDGFSVMTAVLADKLGNEVARSVKTFATNGKLISTVVTYAS